MAKNKIKHDLFDSHMNTYIEFKKTNIELKKTKGNDFCTSIKAKLCSLPFFKNKHKAKEKKIKN